MKQNKGLIKISNEIIENNWDVVFGLFQYCKPTFIEYRFWENDFWYYYLTSPFFDEVGEGEVIPEYNFIISTKEGKYNYTFEKI